MAWPAIVEGVLLESVRGCILLVRLVWASYHGVARVDGPLWSLRRPVAALPDRVLPHP